MKRFLGLLCAVFLAGCSRKPEEIAEIKPAPTPERTFRHPTHGFAIRVPEGWEIKDTGNTPPIVLNLVSPKKGPDDQFRETLSVRIQPGKPGFTAQQYFEESLLVEREQVKDFQLISTAPETIGKTEAVAAITRLDFGVPDPNRASGEKVTGLVVQVLSYTIVHGEKVYTIYAIATPDTFDEYKGIFRSVGLAFEP